jgi:hypothetical protein
MITSLDTDAIIRQSTRIMVVETIGSLDADGQKEELLDEE